MRPRFVGKRPVGVIATGGLPGAYAPPPVLTAWAVTGGGVTSHIRADLGSTAVEMPPPGMPTIPGTITGTQAGPGAIWPSWVQVIPPRPPVPVQPGCPAPVPVIPRTAVAMPVQKAPPRSLATPWPLAIQLWPTAGA